MSTKGMDYVNITFAVSWSANTKDWITCTICCFRNPTCMCVRGRSKSKTTYFFFFTKMLLNIALWYYIAIWAHICVIFHMYHGIFSIVRWEYSYPCRKRLTSTPVANDAFQVESQHLYRRAFQTVAARIFNLLPWEAGHLVGMPLLLCRGIIIVFHLTHLLFRTEGRIAV
jgi:hypothetical protein